MSNYFGAMGTAIYNKLKAGTALVAELGGTAIFEGMGTANQTLPYVIFNHQGGGPENISPGNLQSDIWQVRGYASTRAAANRIEGHVSDLLHRGSLTATGYTNIWTVKETNLSLVENPPDGAKIYSAGGLYRVRVA
jgi:hypothetical protein